MSDIFVFGSGSRLFNSISSNLDFSYKNIYRPYFNNYKINDSIYRSNSEAAFVFSFAAPTSESFHFTKCYDGVTDINESLDLIANKYSHVTIIHIASFAEFQQEVSVIDGQRKIFKALRKDLDFSLMIDNPYAFWKIWQHNEIVKLSNRGNVSVIEFNIPFIDFSNIILNANYYIPNGSPIFSDVDEFDVVRSITLAKALNSIVNNSSKHKPYQEIFCSERKASINELCGISASNKRLRLSKYIVPLFMFVISSFIKTPRFGRIVDKFLVMGGLSKVLSESVELIESRYDNE